MVEKASPKMMTLAMGRHISPPWRERGMRPITVVVAVVRMGRILERAAEHSPLLFSTRITNPAAFSAGQVPRFSESRQ